MSFPTVHEPVSALTMYYGLRLWTEYLEAKAQWEHAHQEYATHVALDRSSSRVALMATASAKDALLTQLRATPEHLAAFGW